MDTGAQFRDKNLPNTSGTKSHRMAAGVPFVEVTHHGNDYSIRRPDGKPHARNTFAFGKVRTQRIVRFIQRALGMQV